MFRPFLNALLILPLFAATGMAAPNIIFILTDDLGYGDLGIFHQNSRDNGAGGGVAGDGLINGSESPHIHTPQLDTMAREGAMLTRHYCAAPVCAPARGSLLQGRDQGHANVRNNSFDKALADNHTLGTLLRQSGYATACIGKWGLQGLPQYTSAAEAFPTKRGFDFFFGYIDHGAGHRHYPKEDISSVPLIVWENSTDVTAGLDKCYSTDLFTARAKKWIVDHNTATPAKPFFLYLTYTAPHAALEVATQAYPSYTGANNSLTGGLQWLGTTGSMISTASGTVNSYIHPQFSAFSASGATARHGSMVRRVDNAVGDIKQLLADLDIDQDTLIVFSSDNGPHLEGSSHVVGIGSAPTQDPRNFQSYGNMDGTKRDHWEAGIRVPTIAWWPGQIDNLDPNTPINSTRPSAFHDWMSTFAEVAGRVPPAWSTGDSLLPELTGTGVQQDSGYLYFEYAVSGTTSSYADFDPSHRGQTRNELQTIFLDDPADGIRYKGVRYNVTSHSQNFRIYNVDTDPGETSDLAASKPLLQQAMKDKVLQVRIDGDYSRPYSNENVPAVAITAVAGLNYKAFEGSWDWVPETDYLTPIASGECTGLDLAKRTQDDHIALEFSGYISVPTDGTYTFSMTADSTVGDNTSGGMLWIHDANVIEDDFNHDGTAQAGTMRLKAGLHPIRVLYKHATGSHDLSLQYSGPGISQQIVPDSVLFIEGVTPPGPPIATDDMASTTGSNTDPGTSVLINVLANDTDDGTPSPLTLTDPGTPLAGTVVIESGQIRYTPNAGFFGIDYFTYTISDGQDTATASIAITVTTGYSAYWNLEEGAGNTATLEQVNSTLSDTFADSWSTETAAPDSENSYSLAGTRFGSNLDSVATGINGSGPKTIMAWINTSSHTDSSGTFFGYSPSLGGGAGQDIRLIVKNGGLRMEVSYGGFEIGSGLSDGNWHMVAFMMNAGDGINDVDVYIDGTYTARSGGGTLINTTTGTEVGFGSDQNGSRGYTGLLDDVAIFDWTLTEAELDFLMVNGVSPTMPLPAGDLVISGDAVPGGTEVVFAWTAIPGQTYSVQTNADLVSGVWNAYTSNIPGFGGTVILTNSTDAVQMFYRILSE